MSHSHLPDAPSTDYDKPQPSDTNIAVPPNHRSFFERIRARHGITHLVLLLLFALTAALGVWQVRRAQEKSALQSSWQSIQQRPRINLNHWASGALKTNESHPSHEWNRSSSSALPETGQNLNLTGSAHFEQALLLSPRSFSPTNGVSKVGSWLLVPFELSMQSSAPVFVVVLMGWTAHQNFNPSFDLPAKDFLNSHQLAASIVRTEGTTENAWTANMQLNGYALRDLSAYSRLKPEQYDDFSKPWLNFDWNNYRSVFAQATKNASSSPVLLPLMVQLTSDSQEPPHKTAFSSPSETRGAGNFLRAQIRQRWDREFSILPPFAENPYMTPARHYGYALTWFSFSLIALGVWMVSGFRSIKHSVKK